MEEFEQLRVIGRGNYGVATLCREKSTDELVVVKTIAVEDMTEEERAQSRQEVALLASFHHPCIVQYKRSFFQDSALHIVMQYCEEGDLATKIKAARKAGKHFEERQILDWFAQLVFAVAYIHERRVLHRDLKSQNVFLTKANTVRLGDFGIAKVLAHTLEAAKTVVGTPYYMAPEICQGKAYNDKSDMWALGCVLYEMATLKHAFQSNNLLGLVFAIVQTKQPPIPTQYSPQLSDLIDRMLCKDADERLSAAEILALPFIAERIASLADGDPESTVGRQTPAYASPGWFVPEADSPVDSENITLAPPRQAEPAAPTAGSSTRIASFNNNTRMPSRSGTRNSGSVVAAHSSSPGTRTSEDSVNASIGRNSSGGGRRRSSLEFENPPPPEPENAADPALRPTAVAHSGRTSLPALPRHPPPISHANPLPSVRGGPASSIGSLSSGGIASPPLMSQGREIGAPPASTSSSTRSSLSKQFLSRAIAAPDRSPQTPDSRITGGGRVGDDLRVQVPEPDDSSMIEDFSRTIKVPPSGPLPSALSSSNQRQISAGLSSNVTPISSRPLLTPVGGSNRRPHTATVLIPVGRSTPMAADGRRLLAPLTSAPAASGTPRPVLQRVSRKSREMSGMPVAVGAEQQRPWTVSHNRYDESRYGDMLQQLPASPTRRQAPAASTLAATLVPHFPDYPGAEVSEDNMAIEEPIGTPEIRQPLKPAPTPPMSTPGRAPLSSLTPARGTPPLPAHFPLARTQSQRSNFSIEVVSPRLTNALTAPAPAAPVSATSTAAPATEDMYSDDTFDEDDDDDTATSEDLGAEVNKIINGADARDHSSGARGGRSALGSHDADVAAVARDVAAHGSDDIEEEAGLSTLRAIARVYLSETMSAPQAVSKLQEWKDSHLSPRPVQRPDVDGMSYEDIKREYVNPVLPQQREPIPTPQIVRRTTSGSRVVAQATPTPPAVYTRDRVDALKRDCVSKLGPHTFQAVHRLLQSKYHDDSFMSGSASAKLKVQLLDALQGRQSLLPVCDDVERLVFMEGIVEANEAASPIVTPVIRSAAAPAPAPIAGPRSVVAATPRPALLPSASVASAHSSPPLHSHSSGLAFRSRSRAV